jgi:hypothetical protein
MTPFEPASRINGEMAATATPADAYFNHLERKT